MNRGKTVLLGWELGAGFGYALRLREIATALAEAGHRPVLALRSLEPGGQMLQQCPFPVVQAPWIIGRLPGSAARRGFVPTGFADLMSVNGFGSADHLYAIARGWRGLIDLVRPDLILATHSPNLTLAAYGRVPVVLFGSAYYTPPVDRETFPALAERARPYADQSRMLEVVRAVQARLGAPQPERLTDTYRGRRRIVMGLPETDPYGHVRNEPCAGLYEPCAPPAAPRQTRLYAYLAGANRLTRAVLAAIEKTGLPGTVHVRDADTSVGSLPRPARVQWSNPAPDLGEACAGASLVIHHGGLGTTLAALAAGRPQVLLPRVFDQHLTARALGDLRTVNTLRGQPDRDRIADAINAMASDPAARQAALAFAGSIRARGLHDARRKIIEASLQALA